MPPGKLDLSSSPFAQPAPELDQPKDRPRRKSIAEELEALKTATDKAESSYAKKKGQHIDRNRPSSLLSPQDGNNQAGSESHRLRSADSGLAWFSTWYLGRDRRGALKIVVGSGGKKKAEWLATCVQ